MKIFSGTSNIPLTEKIAHALGLKLSPIETFVFADGEKRIRIEEEVVDEHCILVQSTATPVAENYMELFFLIDGLKRSGASEITVIVPYLGYQRQDHVFRSGEAVSLDVVIKIIESLGVDRAIAVDVHSIKIPELFHIDMVHVSALPLFAEKIKHLLGSYDSILVSPDMGGLRRIQQMSDMLDGMPWIATVKDRDLDTGKIVIDKIDPKAGAGAQDIKDKQVFIVDDMISSGKTIVQSAELLKKHGAGNIYVCVTHPIFSADAPTLLQDSIISKVFVTDTVFVPKEKYFPKLEVISVAKMLAEQLKIN